MSKEATEIPNSLTAARQSGRPDYDVREHRIQDPEDDNDLMYTPDSVTSYNHYESENDSQDGDDDDDDDDDDFLVYTSCPDCGNDASNVGDDSSFRISRKSTERHDPGRCDLATARQRAVLVGFLIGLSLGLTYVCWTIINKHRDIRIDHNDADPGEASQLDNQSAFRGPISVGAEQTSGIIATIRRPLFVAVLTQEKFLTTRGAACNITWARSSYVTRVEFFAEQSDSPTSQLRHGNTVTYLKGRYADDYFHAHKTFSAIGQICRRHLESHDWFMLSTDDVYVRVNRLHVFLSRRDPEDKWYFGHKTFPVQDVAYTLLRGQPYCVSGAGIVLSRGLMKGLCQVLSYCLSPPVIVYPDVLLARCLQDHLHVSCTGYNKLFVDTYEQREMKLLRHFLEYGQAAITLHPVKSLWTMMALHRQHTESTVRHLLETFRSLEDTRQPSENLTNLLSAGTKFTKVTGPKTLTTDDQLDYISAEGVFDEDTRVYRRDWCRPMEHGTPALNIDLRKVTHLANTSLQLGEGLQCPHMLTGQYRRRERGATYSIDFLCFRADSPRQYVMAHVTVERTLKPLVTKKIRNRKLPPEIVIVISTWQNDPDLFPYLIRLDDVIRGRSERYAVYLLLRTGSEADHDENASLKSDFPDGDQWKAWWSGSGVTSHRVIRYRGKHGDVRSVQHLVHDIRTHFPEATTILTVTEATFDARLVTKCQALARKGKQMYYPYPVRTVLDRATARGGVRYSLVTTSRRPYCLNAADLDTLLAPKDSLLSTTAGQPGKRLKVVRAAEFSVRIRII